MSDINQNIIITVCIETTTLIGLCRSPRPPYTITIEVFPGTVTIRSSIGISIKLADEDVGLTSDVRRVVGQLVVVERRSTE